MKLSCGLLVNPNNDIKNDIVISFERDKIVSVKEKCSEICDLHLKNAIAFPGLINIHDHLKYSWYKRIGRKGDYTSVYYWLTDLYNEFDPIVGKNEDNLNILFQLGVYKQLFSATTTVVNHSRYLKKHILSIKHEYIDIFDEFERELVVQPGFLSELTKNKHSSTFGRSIIESHARALREKRAFMIHAAEGRNGETKTEIKDLRRHGILTPESILVHCINTDETDIGYIKDGGCSIVWCPNSSEFVTGKVPNIRGFLNKDINVCIGTDSSCSGGCNLFAELSFAQDQYKREFREDIESSKLFDMVTVNAAKALKQESRIGFLDSGYMADVAIIDKKTDNPYDDILHSNAESIIALLHKGVFVYGDESVMNYFTIQEDVNYSNFIMNGRKKTVIGNPKSLISDAKKKFGLDRSIWFPFIPKEVGIE